MAAGYNIDPDHHIWSNRLIGKATGISEAVLNLYKDTSPLGTLTTNGVRYRRKVIQVSPLGRKRFSWNTIPIQAVWGLDLLSFMR